MKIIPVIDILNGVAVHGVRGEREQYQRLRSILCKSADPLDFALTFESLGFRNLYLADLDAILGKSTNFNVYKQIINQTNLHLMVDAGISGIPKASLVLATNVSRIVIGSETLASLDFLNKAVKVFGEDKITVSIDLKEGKVMSVSEAISLLDVFSFAQELKKICIDQVIVLDLDRVGTEQGINLELLSNVRKNTEFEVIIGGGIRGLRELEELRALGVSGALVATILHNGKLQVDELKAANFL
jgi:phosphoribosylformimino-5-aminoimidazole carboxamide ribotide isomerase